MAHAVLFVRVPSNLDLIKSLKEEVAEMKKTEASDEKLMFEIAQENKRMSEPLKQALADVERLHKEREEYERDVQTLQKVKAHLLVGTERLKALQWEHEVLQQRYERAVVRGAGCGTLPGRSVLTALCMGCASFRVRKNATSCTRRSKPPCTMSSRRPGSRTCCWRRSWRQRAKTWRRRRHS